MLRLLLASLIVLAPLLPARAGLLEPLIDLRTFPGCHDDKVLGQIVKRFNWAEDKTFKRGIYLADVRGVQPRLVRDGEHRAIPRRYCRATALLTNGHHAKLFYLIEGGVGFVGTKYDVEFCVEGYDPWRVHNGSCRTLRY